jgi:dTDP-4-dehydrorhamnose reductase
MRILVTGATGQVGSALASALQPLGTIVATDRAQLDLARPQDLPLVLDRIAPEIIINSAAYTAVDQAEDEQELAMCINAMAPGVMARWAAAHASPFIHFSTDYVFNGSGERPWCEDDKTEPLSAYGASKLAGEQTVRAAGGLSLIMRTSWVYAATGKNFLRTIARLAREREELRVVADQIGAPTSARLIADAVAGILGERSALDCRVRATQGLVHVAASGETSWHGFAVAIVEGLRSRGVKLAVSRVAPIRSNEYPVKAKRPHNSRLDLGRLHQLFKVNPPDWTRALNTELDQLAQELADTPE